MTNTATPEREPSSADDPSRPPEAPFMGLETLWVQVTGTLCNLTCTHCFISCSPDNHTLEFMSREQIRGYLDEAAELGVKEIYFTGGEPFLHPDIFGILEDALAVAPATVLTNGVLITERSAERLAVLASCSSYSLEIRISLDSPDEESNDAIRGSGVFRKALRGARRLSEVGLLPIVTACELVAEEVGTVAAAPRSSDGERLPNGVRPESVPPRPADESFYGHFYRLLEEQGIDRPRVKILPVFSMGMLAGRNREELLSARMLEGFDTANLQCSAARLAAQDGVYACPILAGEPEARMSTASLAEAQGPCSLYHPSCTTCFQTGMTCRNY